jgi:hypothetical protein
MSAMQAGLSIAPYIHYDRQNLHMLLTGNGDGVLFIEE